MTTIRSPLMVALVAALAIGSSALSVDCDRNCRERQLHWRCLDDDCIWVSVPNCKRCRNNGTSGGFCEPKEYDSLSILACNQQVPTEDVCWDLYSECTRVCNCVQVGAFGPNVEAATFPDDPDYTLTEPIYSCQ